MPVVYFAKRTAVRYDGMLLVCSAVNRSLNPASVPASCMPFSLRGDRAVRINLSPAMATRLTSREGIAPST